MWCYNYSNNSVVHCNKTINPESVLTPVSQFPDGAIRVRPGQLVGQQPPDGLGLPSAGSQRQSGRFLHLQAVRRHPAALQQSVQRAAPRRRQRPRSHSGSRLRAGPVRGRPLLPRATSNRQGGMVGRNAARHTLDQEFFGEPHDGGPQLPR